MQQEVNLFRLNLTNQSVEFMNGVVALTEQSRVGPYNGAGNDTAAMGAKQCSIYRYCLMFGATKDVFCTLHYAACN